MKKSDYKCLKGRPIPETKKERMEQAREDAIEISKHFMKIFIKTNGIKADKAEKI